MPYRQEEKTSSLHPSVIKLLSVQSKEIMLKAKKHKNQVTCESTLREIPNISTESLQPSTAWNEKATQSPLPSKTVTHHRSFII